MTTDTAVWMIAGLEVATAIGIAAFWLTWPKQAHEEPWLPPGDVEHEGPFMWSDAVLALVLLAAAATQVFEEPVGDSLGLIAAGMLAFLGILDLAYFARTGLFKREHDGLMNGAVVTGVLLMSVILTVRFI